MADETAHKIVGRRHSIYRYMVADDYGLSTRLVYAKVVCLNLANILFDAQCAVVLPCIVVLWTLSVYICFVRHIHIQTVAVEENILEN